MTATLELARQLLGFNTINPPGSEADCMRFFADWLDDSGFEVSLSSFGEGRCNLIASLPGAKSGKPLAFTGHLDTVPLGNARWQYDPFGSQMEDGRLYGRGSSDMKAAIAAFAVACVHQREAILAGRGAVLLITGGEETGCDGARALIASATLPEVGALIVGEPTANYPVIGHKGALWLRCETRGKTAHGAMPELGINAIYLAADALGKIQHFSPGAPHPLMKQPTLNVGRIEGGLNINSVPDRTRFDVDIRSAPNLQHATIRERLTTLLGESVTVSTLVDLPAVLSRRIMRGLSRFINAVSRCTLSRLRRAWCPTLPTPRCCCLHWAIRPVLFSAPASRRWRIKPTNTACSADWRRPNSYTVTSFATGWHHRPRRK
ncbi:acetylornithine deacetylase [Klebsiella pneumoniae]|nr:acetylornithine deacetylase [Klebsiella pneumoniae]